MPTPYGTASAAPFRSCSSRMNDEGHDVSGRDVNFTMGGSWLSWGIPSRHHGCFNTKPSSNYLDDLRVTPFRKPPYHNIRHYKFCSRIKYEIIWDYYIVNIISIWHHHFFLHPGLFNLFLSRRDPARQQKQDTLWKWLRLCYWKWPLWFI